MILLKVVPAVIAAMAPYQISKTGDRGPNRLFYSCALAGPVSGAALGHYAAHMSRAFGLRPARQRISLTAFAVNEFRSQAVGQSSSVSGTTPVRIAVSGVGCPGSVDA